ncbi:hypothetical protein [Paraconexibacter algicola]|uniref:hypothetical protein n=1 Tax=Paraconexibacter algicola TaxID=2133960 RepID=UPI0011B2522C|nr:hypothetical protein [Paraconexibacter algicola]
MPTPRRPERPDRWATLYPRAVQTVGLLGAIHEIAISREDRPFVLLFVAALLLGMEGLRAFALRGGGEGSDDPS